MHKTIRLILAFTLITLSAISAEALNTGDGEENVDLIPLGGECTELPSNEPVTCAAGGTYREYDPNDPELPTQRHCYCNSTLSPRFVYVDAYGVLIPNVQVIEGLPYVWDGALWPFDAASGSSELCNNVGPVLFDNPSCTGQAFLAFETQSLAQCARAATGKPRFYRQIASIPTPSDCYGAQKVGGVWTCQLKTCPEQVGSVRPAGIPPVGEAQPPWSLAFQ